MAAPSCLLRWGSRKTCSTDPRRPCTLQQALAALEYHHFGTRFTITRPTITPNIHTRTHTHKHSEGEKQRDRQEEREREGGREGGRGGGTEREREEERERERERERGREREREREREIERERGSDRHTSERSTNGWQQNLPEKNCILHPSIHSPTYSSSQRSVQRPDHPPQPCPSIPPSIHPLCGSCTPAEAQCENSNWLSAKTNNAHSTHFCGLHHDCRSISFVTPPSASPSFAAWRLSRLHAICGSGWSRGLHAVPDPCSQEHRGAYVVCWAAAS